MSEINEEACPVGDVVLGQLYRADRHGLADIIATIAPDVRAALAVYCYRRAHLASIGLAVAAFCDEHALTWQGGMLGADLFVKARTEEAVLDTYQTRRKKVSLSSGIRPALPLVDIEDAPAPQRAFQHIVAQDLI